jgi:GH35 family endo-1,4-beta-xylanase
MQFHIPIRSFLLVALTALPMALQAGDLATNDTRSLKQAAGERFLMGVGTSSKVLANPVDAALVKKHFQILTPDNCMKPQSVQPSEGEWNFKATDSFADFARTNGLQVVGHCLVWAKDDRTDAWMKEENGAPVSRETMLKRIETHVTKVAKRYADVATMWDVVNEAVADGGGGQILRDSVYSRTTGMDFLVTAFKAARAADPDALLIYNDYGDHNPAKLAKIVTMLKELKRLGAPVDAFGMQGHFQIGEDSIKGMRNTIAAMRELGLKVVVSELDIDVIPRNRWWADGGKHREELAKINPYPDGIPDELQRKLAAQYLEVFNVFVENSDIIERVSFWNVHDEESWLNNFPWKRVNHPLFFDRQRKPKPAFDAVHRYLSTSKEKSPPPSQTP